MAYLTAAEFRVCCTNVDVSAILSDLTDAGAQDAYLDELCDDASGDLDGYAEAGGYPAPLVITTQVKRIAFELAWFMLCRRKNCATQARTVG
jgi:phage gp36-like protein